MAKKRGKTLGFKHEAGVVCFSRDAKDCILWSGEVEVFAGLYLLGGGKEVWDDWKSWWETLGSILFIIILNQSWLMYIHSPNWPIGYLIDQHLDVFNMEHWRTLTVNSTCSFMFWFPPAPPPCLPPLFAIVVSLLNLKSYLFIYECVSTGIESIELDWFNSIKGIGMFWVCDDRVCTTCGLRFLKWKNNQSLFFVFFYVQMLCWMLLLSLLCSGHQQESRWLKIMTK